jgi:cytochrome c oxidase subunit II
VRTHRKAALLLVIVVALAAATYLVALRGKGSGGDLLKVDVFARQYSWSFGYPAEGNAFSEKELHVPLGREIEFVMFTQDVEHAFWVPEWQVREQIGPGRISTTTVTPEKAGTYELICSQNCGIDHYLMHAKVVVEPAPSFARWTAGLGRKVPAHLSELVRLETELETIRRRSG